MTTGERIKHTRKSKGCSAEYLAERLSVSPSTIYRYEKGDIEKVPGDVLVSLGDILGVSVAYLMGWENEKEPSTIAELSKEEESLVQLFRTVPIEDRQLVFQMIRAALSSKGLL